MEGLDKIKVIIVEDSAILRDNLRAVLGFVNDYEIVGVCSSGKEAVELSKEKLPNVIFMDIEMDYKMDGIDATTKILESNPQIKIIMLTVQEDVDIIISAFEAGACDYILKTAEPSEIIEAVKKAHHNNSPIRPIIANKIRGELKRVKQTKDNLSNIYKMISRLTSAEISILQSIAEGKKQQEIAREKNIEITTIKTHVRHILKKFNVKKSSLVIELLKKNNALEILKSANKK